MRGQCPNLAVEFFSCSAVALLRFEGMQFLAYPLYKIISLAAQS